MTSKQAKVRQIYLYWSRFLVDVNNDFYLYKKVVAMLPWISYLSLLLNAMGV